jgi:hypothetical protein
MFDDPNTVWTWCNNCGCATGFPRTITTRFEGALGTCHCGHQFRMFFVDRIVQFERTALDPCGENDARLQRPFRIRTADGVEHEVGGPRKKRWKFWK